MRGHDTAHQRVINAGLCSVTGPTTIWAWQCVSGVIESKLSPHLMKCKKKSYPNCLRVLNSRPGLIIRSWGMWPTCTTSITVKRMPSWWTNSPSAHHSKFSINPFHQRQHCSFSERNAIHHTSTQCRVLLSCQIAWRGCYTHSFML